MTQTQLLETILQDESFKSINQSQSLQDFFNARQNDLDESEISKKYRTLDGQLEKQEGCFTKLFTDLNGGDKKSSNTIYEDQEICSSDFFYRQGFFEGIKCVLLNIINTTPGQAVSSAELQPASNGSASQTLPLKLIAALQNYNLPNTLQTSDSLEAFVTARTSNFQVADISKEYRLLQDKKMQFEECLRKLMMELPEEQQKDPFREYGEVESQSNRFFYRQGLYEGVKFLLIVIANILPDPDFSIGANSLSSIL